MDGAQEGLTRDDILDNITLCWLTSTAVSSARLYREMRNSKAGQPQQLTEDMRETFRTIR